jgi:membrane peptidoglycan carboxypeptidase
MLAPHFVQWIIETLEQQYDTGTLLKGGIVVKTSLDYEIQKLAEDALSSNIGVLQQNGANNSSMIYTDSKNGDVLAYVGSLNYFDESIQ